MRRHLAKVTLFMLRESGLLDFMEREKYRQKWNTQVEHAVESIERAYERELSLSVRKRRRTSRDDSRRVADFVPTNEAA